MRLRAVVLDYGGVLTDTDTDADTPLLDVLRRLRAHGIRTGLLSNADGPWELPRAAEFGGLFDVTVLSGVVGLRKPALQIYTLTADRLGVPATACVFVDDLLAHVRGAVTAGMVGVHHTDVETTVLELAALFDVDLTR